MIEDRQIERNNFDVEYEDESLTIRLAIVRLWDDISQVSCSRFNVQLKLRNKEATKVLDDKILDGGTWTVFAHSDHNPNGGHNIRDDEDEKQLHIDVHPKITGQGYNICHKQLCGGNPPDRNGEAIRVVTKYMRSKASELLYEYTEYSPRSKN